MSLSRQAFSTTRANYKKSPIVIINDKAWAQLHWTEQQKIRPLSQQYRRPYNQDGDYDTRIDNFDTDNEREEQ